MLASTSQSTISQNLTNPVKRTDRMMPPQFSVLHGKAILEV
jgi:hypothetical protein